MSILNFMLMMLMNFKQSNYMHIDDADGNGDIDGEKDDNNKVF